MRLADDASTAGTAVDAVLFDMDGVILDTPALHAVAAQACFDRYLSLQRERPAENTRPFALDEYYRLMDGRTRYEGVRAFLASRGIVLSYGDPADPPGHGSVCGLANLKNRYFLDRLQGGGASVFASSITLVRALRARGVATAVVTSSRNGSRILRIAGLDRLFDVRIDATEADALGLVGKPDPAMFLHAAERLAVAPARSAVIEDSLVGVEAARRGRFSRVIGVDRIGQADALLAAGAHVVVSDLADMRLIG